MLNTIKIVVIFPSYHQNISFTFLDRNQAIIGQLCKRLHYTKETKAAWYGTWFWVKNLPKKYFIITKYY